MKVLNIFYNVNTLHISEHLQNKILNLPIRLEQFTDNKKPAKKELVIGIELYLKNIIGRAQV